MLRTTVNGPQRDDIDLRVQARTARDFASEGQQRSLVLALRLAQAGWYQQRSGVRPVLLADDVLGELDPARRRRFWAGLDPESQVLATGTSLPERGTRGMAGVPRERWGVRTGGGGRRAMNFEPWQWALLMCGALLVGVSKTGIAGIGMLFVVIFSQIMPAKQATGLVLPLLCFGDFVAVLSYRQHAAWAHLWRLFPWTAGGVVIGYFALGRLDEWSGHFAWSARLC
jgi:hypothetical protein